MRWRWREEELRKVYKAKARLYRLFLRMEMCYIGGGLVYSLKEQTRGEFVQKLYICFFFLAKLHFTLAIKVANNSPFYIGNRKSHRKSKIAAIRQVLSMFFLGF